MEKTISQRASGWLHVQQALTEGSKEANVTLSFITRNRGSVCLKKKNNTVSVLISQVPNTDNVKIPGASAQDEDGLTLLWNPSSQEAINETGDIYQFREAPMRGDR